MKTCKLCGNDAENNYLGNGWVHTRCPRCGPYRTYERAPVDEKYYPILAAHLYEIGNRSSDAPFDLTWDNITSILAERKAL